MSSYYQRPISIYGSKVVFHAGGCFPREEVCFFDQQLRAIENVVVDMRKSGKMAPIYICGIAGSGKSTFAEVLKSDGNNVELIIPWQEKPGARKGSRQVYDSCKTYVVDDANMLDPGLIMRADRHAELGGVIVIMSQGPLAKKSVLELHSSPRYMMMGLGCLEEVSSSEFWANNRV